MSGVNDNIFVNVSYFWRLSSWQPTCMCRVRPARPVAWPLRGMHPCWWNWRKNTPCRLEGGGFSMTRTHGCPQPKRSPVETQKNTYLSLRRNINQSLIQTHFKTLVAAWWVFPVSRSVLLLMWLPTHGTFDARCPKVFAVVNTCFEFRVSRIFLAVVKKKKTQRTKTSLGVFWGLGGSCCLSFSQQHTWMVLRETLPQLHCQRLPTTTGTLGEPLARHVLRSAGCPLAATLMNRAAFLSTGPSVALDMCAGRERALLSCFSPQNAGSFLTADSVCLRTKMTGFTAGIFF